MSTTTRTLAPEAPRRQRCRAQSCGAEILIVLLDTGNRMPIDPGPVPDGRLLRLEDGRFRVLRKAEREEAQRRGQPLYQSHFVSCPEGPQFRSKQRSRP